MGKGLLTFSRFQFLTLINFINQNLSQAELPLFCQPVCRAGLLQYNCKQNQGICSQHSCLFHCMDILN